MARLIANPESVYDGNHDDSCGYDGDDSDYEASIANPELGRDVQQIVDAYRAAGDEVSPQHAFYAWGAYSESLSAHWLMPRGDLVASTRRFLIPFKAL